MYQHTACRPPKGKEAEVRARKRVSLRNHSDNFFHKLPATITSSGLSNTFVT